MAETWIPGAARVPGPAWKQGYGWIPRRSLAQIEGDIKHSAEGSYQGTLNVLNGSRQASWTFTVPKIQIGGVRFAQHYPLESITWHAGVAGDANPQTDITGNIALIGIEHAGMAGETLTPHQIAMTIEISQFLRDHTRAGISPPELRNNLWEHKWMKATACPSDRIPWAPIIAGLQAPAPPPPPPPPPEEEMYTLVKVKGFRAVYEFNGGQFTHLISGAAVVAAGYGTSWSSKVVELEPNDRGNILHPHGDKQLPVIFPNGLKEVM